jgi:hypothetical protein
MDSNFFLKPQIGPHKKYEALRASFVDGLSDLPRGKSQNRSQAEEHVIAFCIIKTKAISLFWL